jgi:serine/threonine protein kinase
MYMVTPYMDHDLSGLLENPDVHFTEPQIKCYMLQLLEGLRFLHNVGALLLMTLLRSSSTTPLTYWTTAEKDPAPRYER